MDHRNAGHIGATRSRRTRLVGAVTAIAAAVALTASSCVLNGAWATTAPNNPASPGVSSSLASVSCPTSDFCMAVGSFRPDPAVYTIEPIVQTWDGSTWSMVPFDSGAVPGPDDHGARTVSVSCGSPTTCAVVWDRLVDDEQLKQFSVLDDGVWRHAAFPVQPDSLSAQTSCADDGTCVFALEFGLTVTWDGAGFEVFTSAQGTYTPYLSSLSCTAIDGCLGTSAFSNAAHRWNGSTWTSEALPAVPGTSSSWASLDCTSGHRCVAVGTSYSSTPGVPAKALAARYEGTSWTIAPTPLPDSGALVSVSCASMAACVAVGTATVGSPGATQPVALAWNGGDWYRAGDPPLPAGAAYRSIGCGVGDLCMAVGTVTTGGVAAPLASTYAWEPTS